MDSPVFCDQCRSLYPADGLNYFELLGLAPTYALDPGALRQRYLELSRKVHPDRHGDASAADVSLRLSAQLNDAYRVLGDQVLRAEYLLELCGGPSAREDRSVPPAVLATTLRLRDEVAEGREAADAAALDRCRTAARGQYDETLAGISAAAAKLPGDAELRRELRSRLNSIRYFQKLLAEL